MIFEIVAMAGCLGLHCCDLHAEDSRQEGGPSDNLNDSFGIFFAGERRILLTGSPTRQVRHTVRPGSVARVLAGRVGAVLALACFLSGCASLAPAPETPRVVAQLPEKFPNQEDGIQPYDPVGWWQGFDDPVLDELVARADIANLEIEAAVARVSEARAAARAAGAALLPQISGSGSAQYSNSPLSGSGFGEILDRDNEPAQPPGMPGALPSRLTTRTYGLALNLSYEADFWGRVRNDARAATEEALAAESDLKTARLGVLADLISTYFQIVDLRASIGFTLESVDLLADRLERAEQRYASGLTGSFELYQVRQDYRQAQSSLPQMESELAAAEARLAVLVGAYPGTIDLSRPMLPRLIFEPVPAGLPSALLGQRPDVAAAAYRYEATRLRIGARRAELYPQLSLSGGVGTQGGEPAAAFDIMDNWVLNLGAGLTAPIFQGGRIRANIDAAEARHAQQAANFAQTVLTAYQEVTAALADYEEQRQRYRFLTEQVREANASSRLQAERFAAGVADFNAYLDAQRTHLQALQSQSSAGRDVALARLAIHRALGGEWRGSAPQMTERQAP